MPNKRNPHKDLRGVVKQALREAVERDSSWAYADLADDLIACHSGLLDQIDFRRDAVVVLLQKHGKSLEADAGALEQQAFYFAAPRVLTLGEGQHIGTEKAKLEHLLEHERIQSANIQNCMDSNGRFRSFVEWLRPAMEGTALTVEQARERISGQAA